MTGRLPRVVVVGGGFGGAYTARALLRRTRGAVDLTIVSATNYLLFAPLLPEAACGAIEQRHVVIPLRHMLPHARVVTGVVDSVDIAGRRADVELPDGVRRTIEWDRLVLAPGGVPNIFPVPGLLDRAVGVKSLAECTWLRNHVIAQLELAESEPDEHRRRELLTFVFVGGGYAGIEMLAELEAMVRRILRWYPRLNRSEFDWVLVDAAPRILGELPERLSGYVHERLTRRRIRVLSRTTIAHVDGTEIVLSTGERLRSETLVWAAGVAPSPLVATLGVPLQRGRLPVDAELQVPGASGVWALGDCASVPNGAEEGRPCPPTAQHALRQAKLVGLNVAASIGFGTASTFRHPNRGSVATLGLGDGVAQMGPITMRGPLAWFAARGYHLLAVPTLSRKIRVALDWTTQLLLPADIGQLGQAGRRPRLDDVVGAAQRQDPVREPVDSRSS
ncbi:MAG: FAD-dependent pyridine nucleotide-disulfide oxidoreductase [Thermoleophilia bacterium]|nr:FAD-dependent pyridine nucleotide-disulfide oxidoreductase [Thermoleophilia bacterium]